EGFHGLADALYLDRVGLEIPLEEALLTVQHAAPAIEALREIHVDIDLSSLRETEKNGGAILNIDFELTDPASHACELTRGTEQPRHVIQFVRAVQNDPAPDLALSGVPLAEILPR